jgi:NADH:ubiquinone oxidoreductase subunit 6 (subunit J)
MALEAELLAIGGFLLTAILLAVPITIVVYVGKFLKAKLQKKYKKLSWIQSAFASVFVITFVLLALLYSYPAISSFGNSNNDLPGTTNFLVPDETSGLVETAVQSTSLQDSIFSFFLNVGRLLVIAFVVSILIMPFVFIGAFVFESFAKKSKSFLAKTYAAVLVCTIIVWIIMILFPWIQASLLYYVFLS